MGQGVRQDDVRRCSDHSAAEQGHPKAQYNLGVMYAEGRGIPLNFEEAARWFEAAANQGMSRALYNLAVLTDEGLGVKQDEKKVELSALRRFEVTNGLSKYSLVRGWRLLKVVPT